MRHDQLQAVAWEASEGLNTNRRRVTSRRFLPLPRPRSGHDPWQERGRVAAQAVIDEM